MKMGIELGQGSMFELNPVSRDVTTPQGFVLILGFFLNCTMLPHNNQVF